jgi:hypothetical protein
MKTLFILAALAASQVQAGICQTKTITITYKDDQGYGGILSNGQPAMINSSALDLPLPRQYKMKVMYITSIPMPMGEWNSIRVYQECN